MHANIGRRKRNPPTPPKEYGNTGMLSYPCINNRLIDLWNIYACIRFGTLVGIRKTKEIKMGYKYNS